ncbi:MAG: DUF6489 family protein [Novosphingobium sp.]|uniref:DUF6489 family protein n=1 Tax=Tsuneonella sp. CC-YZS046 TaxID=3042152 RepID=UPI002D76F1DB|nr:DUF6489 family protein [Tsuneonella sp. CC-YZS046]WRO65963.1 DUF6489 family protein [Tsuneonella sp. CC-YZS046]
MKVNIEIDCTPDEARRFLGLPDVTPLNELYIENVRNAMSGATSLEQLQELSKQFAPMGQMGLKLFQNFMEGGAAFAEGAGGKRGG